jgi:hypothetical protein
MPYPVMSKPRILIVVLSGSERDRWVSPRLFEAVIALTYDARLAVHVETTNRDRYEVARNTCVKAARDMQADFLVMIDNDMVLPLGFADILLRIATSTKPIVGIPSARVNGDGSVTSLAPFDNGERDGEFQRTGCVGGGVMILSSEVWRVIPCGPWFRWLTNDDELLTRKASEDYAFCELAQEHGLTVWAHQSTAGHLKTIDITRGTK